MPYLSTIKIAVVLLTLCMTSTSAIAERYMSYAIIQTLQVDIPYVQSLPDSIYTKTEAVRLKTDDFWRDVMSNVLWKRLLPEEMWYEDLSDRTMARKKISEALQVEVIPETNLIRVELSLEAEEVTLVLRVLIDEYRNNLKLRTSKLLRQIGRPIMFEKKRNGDDLRLFEEQIKLDIWEPLRKYDLLEADIENLRKELLNLELKISSSVDSTTETKQLKQRLLGVERLLEAKLEQIKELAELHKDYEYLLFNYATEQKRTFDIDRDYTEDQRRQASIDELIDSFEFAFQEPTWAVKIDN